MNRILGGKESQSRGFRPKGDMGRKDVRKVRGRERS